MAGAADGGASEHVLCAGGAAADLLYASALDVPVGQANVDFAGIALLINTGTVAIDTTTFLAIADDVPGYNATPVITVGQLGDVAPVGQAVGSWSLDPALLDPYLVEPWTDQVQPRVDLSLGYDIPGGGDFQILMVVDQDPMGGALPIDVHVAGSGTPRVVETARLPLTCTSQ